MINAKTTQSLRAWSGKYHAQGNYKDFLKINGQDYQPVPTDFTLESFIDTLAKQYAASKWVYIKRVNKSNDLMVVCKCPINGNHHNAIDDFGGMDREVFNDPGTG